MYKNFNACITKILEKSKVKESNPRYVLKKLLQDIDNLEKFYSNPEYRNRLVWANYRSSEYFQLGQIYGLEEKLKDGLALKG